MKGGYDTGGEIPEIRMVGMDGTQSNRFLSRHTIEVRWWVKLDINLRGVGLKSSNAFFF